MTVFKIMKTVLLILMICLQVKVQCVLCNLPESLINWCCQLKKKFFCILNIFLEMFLKNWNAKNSELFKVYNY